MHLHLVWLKKDIRISDHAPLHAAVEAGPGYDHFATEFRE